MRDYTRILGLLHLVLIEIRATKNLEKSSILADVVHNVPIMIQNERSVEDITEEIRSKARRHDVEEYFLKLVEITDRPSCCDSDS